MVLAFARSDSAPPGGSDRSARRCGSRRVSSTTLKRDCEPAAQGQPATTPCARATPPTAAPPCRRSARLRQSSGTAPPLSRYRIRWRRRDAPTRRHRTAQRKRRPAGPRPRLAGHAEERPARTMSNRTQARRLARENPGRPSLREHEPGDHRGPDDERYRDGQADDSDAIAAIARRTAPGVRRQRHSARRAAPAGRGRGPMPATGRPGGRAQPRPEPQQAGEWQRAWCDAVTRATRATARRAVLGRRHQNGSPPSRCIKGVDEGWSCRWGRRACSMSSIGQPLPARRVPRTGTGRRVVCSAPK